MPDDLIQVDKLVASGKHESRSGAVRAGIKLLLSQIKPEKGGLMSDK